MFKINILGLLIIIRVKSKFLFLLTGNRNFLYFYSLKLKIDFLQVFNANFIFRYSAYYVFGALQSEAFDSSPFVFVPLRSLSLATVHHRSLPSKTSFHVGQYGPFLKQNREKSVMNGDTREKRSWTVWAIRTGLYVNGRSRTKKNGRLNFVTEQ